MFFKKFSLQISYDLALYFTMSKWKLIINHHAFGDDVILLVLVIISWHSYCDIKFHWLCVNNDRCLSKVDLPIIKNNTKTCPLSSVRTHGQSPKSRFRNYRLWCSSDALSKSFRIAAGMMSMLATLSPFFNLMATEPLVFLPTARTWVHSSHRSKGEDWELWMPVFRM